MDEEIDRLVVRVRADTGLFARDVAAMRAQLGTPLEAGADKAGRAIETALVRAARNGRLGFDDLRRTALGALGEIAAAALHSGIGNLFGAGAKPGGLGSLLGGLLGGGAANPRAGSAGSAGGLVSAGAGLIGSVLGLPGRATGGAVAPGRGYMVGERGPELFVPTASGRIEPAAGAAARDVRVSITLNAPGGGEPQALARSGRQVARAVRAALETAER